jgi:hypothetical protein
MPDTLEVFFCQARTRDGARLQKCLQFENPGFGRKRITLTGEETA